MVSFTPMMRQYCTIKEQHKDALLFFRLGDFYELFFDDAIVASKELEITLTGRDCGMDERAPMCGVPYHAVDGYIAKLINKGFKVAICEQTQDPKDAKGIVERDVIRIVTPGTITEPSSLDGTKNNYLVSLYAVGEVYGLAAADITTGEFYVSEFDGSQSKYLLFTELSKLSPSEIILCENSQENIKLSDFFKQTNSIPVTIYHNWAFDFRTAYQKLTSYFSVYSLEGFGFESLKCAISSAGALLEYITQTQKEALKNINRVKTHYPTNFMILDNNTRKNLELVENAREKGKKNSLLWLLDKTNTAFGARMLRRWILQPLTEVKDIAMRLEGVKELTEESELLKKLRDTLSKIYDLERLSGKISCNNANARDLIAIKQSLSFLPMVKSTIQNMQSPIINNCWTEIDTLDDVYDLIDQTILEEPSIVLKEGHLIKSGYDLDLDSYRAAMTDGREWISALEQREREKTGIKNLKAGFNKVFGYYLEVTKSYYELVPDYFIRKQTLSNCERFITKELKDVEDTILGAEEKSIRLEYEIFIRVRDQLSNHILRIQKTAQSLATLDVLTSFAKIAIENNYVCPEVTDNKEIQITNGRHPLVEKLVEHSMFIPNNTYLDDRDDQVLIITGPNMAGKSTYLRQVALIVVMAQIGCFVPAERVIIGVVDRIFTRIGASDDLNSGQSTFMVEMNEVANILHNATSRSLLVLDEIGRGTSTFDGLSIAWSVIEHISKQKETRAKTIFATHYHELTELEGKLMGVKNYCISVKEHGEEIIFLRKIIRGSADKSFGIQVAKLAGLPEAVIKRASEILRKLEEADINNVNRGKKRKKSEQLSIFEIKKSVIEEELAKTDVYSMTPIEAMNLLYSLSLRAKSVSERMKTDD